MPPGELGVDMGFHSSAAAVVEVREAVIEVEGQWTHAEERDGGEAATSRGEGFHNYSVASFANPSMDKRMSESLFRGKGCGRRGDEMEICCCAKVYLAIARRGSIDASPARIPIRSKPNAQPPLSGSVLFS